MASQVAWLNFDVEQQRRTQLMMAALAAQSTVDELGLGVIRDLIANTLHPNMTVLLTRARYLLFVPRIYRELTSTTTDALIAEGRRAEGRLINQLVSHYQVGGVGDDRGIIGRLRGDDTKQLASVAYWPLLRNLHILKVGGSITDYCRHRAETSSARHARSVFHSEDDIAEIADGSWAELPSDSGVATSFELSRDEAEWLRDKFLAADERPSDSQSLISWMLQQREWVSGVPRAWDHPSRSAFPPQTADAMWLGRDLDRLVHSARILYNLLCARGRPPGPKQDELVDKYEVAMGKWRDTLSGDALPGAERLTEINSWAEHALTRVNASGAANMRWRLTTRFLERWRQIADQGTDLALDPDAAALITTREGNLKPGRARLKDPALLTGWLGDSGYGRFDYNWLVTNRILSDIHAGLRTPAIELGGDA